VGKGPDPSPPPADAGLEGRPEGADPLRLVLPAALALGVTAVCLWFLVTPQILASFARVLAQASPPPLLAAFVLVAVVQWLRAWRFAVMMTGRLALPGAELVRIAFQLNFWNFVLPLRLGELSYPVLMNRRLGYGLLHATGVLLIARLFDLAVVAAILLGAAAVLGLWPGPWRVVLSLAALGSAMAPFGLAVAGLALRPYMTRLPRIGDAAARLTAGFEAIGGYAAGLTAVGLSVALWLVFGLAAILVAWAVVATVSPAAAMLGGAAGNVAFALPINGIAGIGPSQAAWVAATTWAGVPWDDAVVSALALHAVVLSNALLCGAVAMVGSSAARAMPDRRS
jgi:uncharacterized membrane protein YbhN (UPF0104 family)